MDGAVSCGPGGVNDRHEADDGNQNERVHRNVSRYVDQIVRGGPWRIRLKNNYIIRNDLEGPIVCGRYENVWFSIGGQCPNVVLLIR